MTVTIGEIHDRETEMSDPDASSAKRAWRVTTDSRSIREAAIYSAGSLYFPRRFDPHPDNGFLTCRKIGIVNQSDSPLHWIVTADYSSAPIDRREREKEIYQNPLDRPAKITWDSQPYRRATATAKYIQIVDSTGDVLVDDFGESCVNAAGDFLDPPVEEDRSFWSISIEKNVVGVPDWILDTDQPVNESSVTIGGKSFDRGELRLRRIRISDLKTEGVYDYYTVSLEIEYRKDGHHILAQNQGYREPAVVNGSVAMIAILDGYKQPTNSPWPLDETGAAIRPPDPDTVTFLKIRTFEYLDFNTLPLT